METTVNGRMGGPEVGVAYLPAIVSTRQRLTSALAAVDVDGVEHLDVELWIGGTITSHEADGFTARLRYVAQPARLVLAVTVPATDARLDADAAGPSEVVGWIARALETAPVPRSARGLRLAALCDVVGSLRAS